VSSLRPPRVSVHGGHSAEFCSHARDRLTEIVARYAELGFAWVGLTEHMPAPSDALVPPEERAAGLDARAMLERFAAYVAEARRLQREYAGRLRIGVGFETEVCTGSRALVRELIERFEPDYVVGSVHHVDDVCIDASPELHAEAARRAGGIDALYVRYFDLQYDLITWLRPAVVGHFDLIRLLDPGYEARLRRPGIARRARRNLEAIAEYGGILDFNVRALAKGQREPYVSGPLLAQALQLGIPVVPGDDSHGVADVGRNVDEGIALLRAAGFALDWAIPGPSSIEQAACK
jgi:histidinol-phosphatase (PHP family)